MIGGASVEDTLTLWASSLRDVKQRIRPLFTQERVVGSAGQFLDGLLGNEPRKTGWMRAEAAGDPGPWRQQAILGRGRWDADALRDNGRGDCHPSAGRRAVPKLIKLHNLCGTDLRGGRIFTIGSKNTIHGWQSSFTAPAGQ